MCRLLLVKSHSSFSISDYLKPFAQIAQHSREYQGHGWGCAFLNQGKWNLYHNITPVWEDDLDQFEQATMVLAHARSAFRDEGITVENNMPFQKNDVVYIFNGELHGVRLKEQGKIGAEKIFNYILRFYKSDLLEALVKGTYIIEKRSAYIRAMNIIIADYQQICIASLFNQEPDYFTMYQQRSTDSLVVCSEPFAAESGWQPVANRTKKELIL